MSWWEQATCLAENAANDLFYPKSYSSSEGLAQIDEALGYCSRCPVRDRCLAEELAKEGTISEKYRYGVRGGKTPAERAALSKSLLTPAA
ncbi:WhiB family transcriptional regulator [Kitasatospora sp. NPDC056731]|uniref:WhiB family transcriptional regulator n=1 Tax=Kitasatospora sp. NPDC056731 TaxID=3155422 RepID=UPI0034225658